MPLIVRFQPFRLEKNQKLFSEITIIEIDQNTFTCVSEEGICCVYSRWTLECLSDDIDILSVKSKLTRGASEWFNKTFILDSRGDSSDQLVGIPHRGFATTQAMLKNFLQLISPADYGIVRVNINVRWKYDVCPGIESTYLIKNPSLRRSTSGISLCGDDYGYGWYDDISKKYCFNQKRIDTNFNTVIHSNFYNENLGNLKKVIISFSRPTLEEITEFTKNLEV